MTGDDNPRRPQSRLENDDPQYCRKCGAPIEKDGHTDDDGRPLAWVTYDMFVDEPQWVILERCRQCWIEDKRRKVKLTADERYGGI